MRTGTSAVDKGFVITRQQVRWPVHRSRIVPLICLVIGIGATVCSLLGLLSRAHPTPAFSTHGGLVDLYDGGVYRFDSLFSGAANRGTDAITLGVALPLLVVSVWRFRRGSPRWHLVLTGVLLWFLYVYATMAVGASFNPLFLVYVVVFSAGLWSFGFTVRGFDLDWLGGIIGRLPRRGPAIFLIASGVLTAVLWCIPVLVAQVSGSMPTRLDGYTTLVTVAIDAAIITPAAIIAGILVWRRKAAGYLAAIPLLILEALLAPLIAAQTISQLLAGITFAPSEMIGPLAGFSILALAAGAVLWAVLRRLPSSLSIMSCAATPQMEVASNSSGAG
jgi:hypothetical protein